jgi:hypothetical protein
MSSSIGGNPDSTRSPDVLHQQRDDTNLEDDHRDAVRVGQRQLPKLRWHRTGQLQLPKLWRRRTGQLQLSPFRVGYSFMLYKGLETGAGIQHAQNKHVYKNTGM